MNSLAPEWASFPTHAGHSAYGQPVKTHAELLACNDNLNQLRQSLTPSSGLGPPQRQPAP